MATSQVILGRMITDQVKQYPQNTPINHSEFQIYSQFGEDGIIQFITHHLRHEIKNKIFIEIGVQNYTEANTRFLLEKDAWQGILIDACEADIHQIHSSDFYWRNNLFAKQKFITRDNINSTLSELNLPQDIGLLSLDIDGNDYWVLQNLNVLNPAIIIVEYNSFFGPEAAISVPYREHFCWREHHPAVYFGASLSAFCHLLEDRGYELLGSTTAGNNAFFIHKEVNQGKLPTVSCAEGYRQALFNSIPCHSPHKFTDQLKYLQYHQVVNVKNNTLYRLDGKPITSHSLSPLFNHIEDFLQSDQEDFILNAYRYLLCREPDELGYAHFSQQFNRRKNKEEILRQIRFSPEGKAIDTHVIGLMEKDNTSPNPIGYLSADSVRYTP